MEATLVQQLKTWYHLQNKPIIIGICGAADVGKSTLTRTLVQQLKGQGYVVDYLSLDTFLCKRKDRISLGLSGYELKANDMDAAFHCLQGLKNGVVFEYYAYNHTTGENERKSREIVLPQILLVEGLHTFCAPIVDLMDYKIFIDGSREVLQHLRYINNVHKRKMDLAIAAENLDREYQHYETNVLPYKEVADLVITVDREWNYQAASF